MESHFNQRWFGTNEMGQHTFFIEVYSSNILDELCFETSLPIELFSTPGVTIMVNKLCKKDISLVERNNVAALIIEKIERNTDYEKYYFPSCVLDRNGKFCEEYASTLYELKCGTSIKEYTPYSPFSNETIFRDFRSNFFYEEIQQESILVDKIAFEDCINGNSTLQKAFAEIYSETSEYYYHTSTTNGISLGFYCVVLNKELTFIFFTNLQEITAVIP